MKKIYLLTFTLLFNWTYSQVVFCPPGAEWHYNFLDNNMSHNYTYSNVMIKYDRDSIAGDDTAKIVRHSQFFSRHNMKYIDFTLIKQNGDTIWFKNYFTDHQWQILYNFNVKVSDFWTTTIKFDNISTTTFTTLVTAISYTTINNVYLKKISAQVTHISNWSGQNITITEKIGASSFLFYYPNITESDGDYVSDFLCYKDQAFGLYQYSAYPCDYANPAGLTSLASKDILLYPNPTKSAIYIEYQNSEDYAIRITNMMGQEVYTKLCSRENKINEVDVDRLPCGIYLMQLMHEGKVHRTAKIIKE